MWRAPQGWTRSHATADENGTPTPGRLLDHRPLDEPPFYVIEATPAITFTFGGLLIDAGAHAPSASSAGRLPVPGLLAAGADACGPAPAPVFGLSAARIALIETPAPVGH